MATGIETDFTVYPYSKCIRHTSATDTVHTVQEFYSWLMDLFDEPGYMSYEKPIQYKTPVSYTMTNGWFLDNGDGSEILKYLTGGSIDTAGYGDGSNDEVLMIDLDGTTDWIAGDKDKNIQHSGSTTIGPLLAYKNDYPTDNYARIWVRNLNEVTAPVDGNSIITLSGTGAGTIDEDVSSGNEIYCNLYTIASFAGSPNPQVYIRQKHPVDTTNNPSTYVRVEEWSTLDNFDPGTIDILLPVKLGGNLIDSGLINVYVRHTGDTFTHTANVDLSSGDRTPVATETSPDTVNITEGECYLLYDNSSTGAFSSGDFIQNTSAGGTVKPDWHAEVVSVTEFSDDSTGVLILRSLSGTITDDDSIYVGSVDSGDANGTEGDTYISYSTVTVAPDGDDIGKPVEGGTSGAHRILRGFDTAAKKCVLQVYHTHGSTDGQTYTGSGRACLYKAFSSGEQVDAPTSGTSDMDVVLNADSTTLTSGFSDITIAHINGTLDYKSKDGDLTVGERVTWNAGADSAIVVADDSSYPTTTGNVTLANVTSDPVEDDVLVGDISGNSVTGDSGGFTDAYKEGFEFSLQSTGAEYAVFIEGGSIYYEGRTFEDIYAYLQYKCREGETDTFSTSDGSSYTTVQGQFYITAYSSYSISKVAPFGTIAGGVFFGAQGVWVQGMDTSDNNSLKLTDNGGTLRQPYTSITITISNTRIGDTIAVFLEDGSTGEPDKDQYTCASPAIEGDSSLVKAEPATPFPNDTPSTGAVYVVACDEQAEHRYRYTSWTGTTLTLAAQVNGTCDSNTSTTTIIDTSKFSAGVQRGDIVHRVGNPDDNAWCYIASVVNASQITTTVLSNGDAWAQGDLFEINSLVQNYNASDTFFIPYLEAIETAGSDGTPGTETESLTYVEDRAVVIRARNSSHSSYLIQPFNTTGDIRNTGLVQSIIRNEDTVYS